MNSTEMSNICSSKILISMLQFRFWCLPIKYALYPDAQQKSLETNVINKRV
jgi:hypothetical protein